MKPTEEQLRILRLMAKGWELGFVQVLDAEYETVPVSAYLYLRVRGGGYCPEEKIQLDVFYALRQNGFIVEAEKSFISTFYKITESGFALTVEDKI